MRELNPTERKREVMRLLGRLEELYPDRFRYLMGPAWLVLYEGVWCVLIVHKSYLLPPFLFEVLAGLLGRKLNVCGMDNLRSLEVYIFGLEHKNDTRIFSTVL